MLWVAFVTFTTGSETYKTIIFRKKKQTCLRESLRKLENIKKKPIQLPMDNKSLHDFVGKRLLLTRIMNVLIVIQKGVVFLFKAV